MLRFLRRVAGDAGVPDVTDVDLITRYSRTHDQSAFELILWRHGAMVLRVCRDVSGTEHDAEDAFQATFLALARKAASIRNRESLGAWLYRIAHHAALRARRQRLRTSNRIDNRYEVDELPARSEASAEAILDEHRALLQEEVLRLPSKYRLPVILCYLKGLTHAEAAHELGWPRGTVAGRLARARDFLRKRLVRRGVGLSVIPSLFSVRPTILPATLIQSTVRDCTHVLSGLPAMGASSSRVVDLTKGVLQEMFWNKMKLVTAVLVAVALAGGGIGAWTSRPVGRAQDAQNESVPQAQKAEELQMVRSARQRTVANLRQIALAMAVYEGEHEHFPLAAI